MKSAIRPLRAPSRPVCQICDHILSQPAARRSILTSSTLKTPSLRRQPARQNAPFTAAPTLQFLTRRSREPVEPEIERPGSEVTVPIDEQLRQTEAHIAEICNSPKVLPEEATLRVIYELDNIARRAIALRAGNTRNKVKLNLRQSSASAILNLDGDEAPASKPAPKKQDTAKDLPSPAHLSQLAENLLKHPNVFISPTILSAYVNLQTLLRHPRSIPEIFHLYAHKPIPEEGSSPPKFTTPKPWGPRQAIPAAVAEKALDAAIAAKDMPGALAVIDTSYRAPAFKVHKTLTKVLPPFTLAAMMPLPLYKLAEEISLYHGYLDPVKFKMYAFMGFMTYFTCTGTLGYVAFTTANEHHERVVWQPGTRLTERWVREEERAALDKIAVAWGFKETWKRGDEEGEEWEGLRQWCLLRGLWLDKPDLLPGMNPPLSNEM